MSDLSEFLLARIAEDEAVAQKAERARYEREGVHYALDSTPRFDPLHSQVPVRLDLTRVLAECEAKRRLIEAVVDKDPFDAMGAESAYEVLILSHLALPYADHPDYRDEWRP